MKLALVVAASKNGVIGNSGKLPWHLPADLKRFKQLTLGHTVIMGRKTFEAIGKPLAGRTNIVITRQKGFQAGGATVAHSLEQALLFCQDAEEAFVIGGAEIYRQALPRAHRIDLTRIERDFPGDTHLFEIDPVVWRETVRQEFPPDAENPFPYCLITYERR